MLISKPIIDHVDGRARMSFEITLEADGALFSQSGTSHKTLWFDWPEHYIAHPTKLSDAALLAMLPVAMTLKEPRIRLDGAVSPTLLINAIEAVAIYASYYPGTAHEVPIEATAADNTPPPSERIASFFSGGVDSLFNIAESERLALLYGTPKITDLWLIGGMDIPLEDEDLWERVQTILGSIRQQLPNTQVTAIRTNARDFQNGIVDWADMGFSSILGACAKIMAPAAGEVLLGSAFTYHDLCPHASTPLVDPMWSCSSQRVRHFTCRASRSQKIALVSSERPDLLQHLRVCWENPGGAINCGVCEKCLRTQVELLIEGALTYAPVFDRTLSPETLRGLTLGAAKDELTRWKLDGWQKKADTLRSMGHEDFAGIIEDQIKVATLHGSSSFRALRKIVPAPARRAMKKLVFRA